MKTDELDVKISEKIVKVKCHQDSDYLRVFTESIEARSDLSEKEKNVIKSTLLKDPNIIFCLQKGSMITITTSFIILLWMYYVVY